jgi:hypothetical protein
MLMKDSLKVLRSLRADARKSSANIGLECQYPPEAVDLLRQAIESQTIRKYASLLDYRRLNLLRVHVAVDAEQQDNLMQYLDTHPGMNSVARTRNGLYADMVFGDLASLYRFLEALQDFDPQKIDVYHIIDIIKEETFSPE